MTINRREPYAFTSVDGVTLRGGLVGEMAGKTVVIEMLPYRYADMIAPRDETIGAELAEVGFSHLRLDTRGAGESGGILEDEYHKAEIADLHAAIAACRKAGAREVWLMGNSWGGIIASAAAWSDNAEYRPDTVVISCAAPDNFACDAHRLEGFHLIENWIWGTACVTCATLPPRDEVGSGVTKRDKWMARLEASRPFPTLWAQRTKADPAWVRAEDGLRRAAVEGVRVLYLGGVRDPYASGAYEAFDTSSADMLLGTWAHGYPLIGADGVALGKLLSRYDAFRKEQPLPKDMRGLLIADARTPGATQPEWQSLRPDSHVEFHPSSITSQVMPWQIGAVNEGRWCSGGGGGDPTVEGGSGTTMPGAATIDFAITKPLQLAGRPTLHLQLTPAPVGASVGCRLSVVLPNGREAALGRGIGAVSSTGEVTLRIEVTCAAIPAGSLLRARVSRGWWPWIIPVFRGGDVACEVRHAMLRTPTAERTCAVDITPSQSRENSWIDFGGEGDKRTSEDDGNGNGFLKAVSSWGAKHLDGRSSSEEVIEEGAANQYAFNHLVQWKAEVNGASVTARTNLTGTSNPNSIGPHGARVKSTVAIKAEVDNKIIFERTIDDEMDL